METIKVQAQVDANGILKLELPTSLPAQEVEVVVVLNPLFKAASTESWSEFVDRMYGALADDPIERPPQLPLEERDSTCLS